MQRLSQKIYQEVIALIHQKSCKEQRAYPAYSEVTENYAFAVLCFCKSLPCQVKSLFLNFTRTWKYRFGKEPAGQLIFEIFFSSESQDKIAFELLSSCPLASLISSCSLGWVSLLEPDFSSSLKILFSFPSLFAISCGNSCWHNSEQYPGRGRDWAWARSYTSRDARGGNQFARSCLWLPSCNSLPEYSPRKDNFRTHWKHQVCPKLRLSLIVW